MDESEHPGVLRDEFHSLLSHATDAHRFYTGDYDFETYEVKGESWERYHRQKKERSRPKKPVYVREFV